MTPRTLALVCTPIAMLAFAGNSLLCRIALTETRIDPASFTTIRIAAGALTLLAIARWRSGRTALAGNWPSAIALFVYAAAISFAYTQLSAATGALILFGAVQVTMVGHGAMHGERLRGWRLSGLLFAVAGLFVLLSPGLSAPSSAPAVAMFVAGAAWGIYSLRGAHGGDPLHETAGNFLRAVLPASTLSLAMFTKASVDPAGFAYAVASGAAASGIGYALWYAALPALNAMTAAAVQLTVPVITAAAALVLLDERPTLRIAAAAVVVLGGVAMVVFDKARAPRSRT